MSEFRQPNNDEHMAIVGTNGTGKTQFGAWILSLKDLANQINFIVDYKGDELLNELKRTREFDPRKKLPTENGLYIIHAQPFEYFDEHMRAFMYRLWDRENAGLYVDEGYMIPAEKRGAFQALLTQGRSKNIPVITLSQRPVGLNRFVFSESNHTVVFDLNDDRDKDVVKEFTPKGFTDWCPPDFGELDPHTGEMHLPKYHARWYNKPDRSRFVLRPVPSAPEIVDAIDSQLKPQQRWL